MTEPVRVLCVCTHNRTRSVLTAGLLRQHLSDLGVVAAVSSAGTMAGGYPATAHTVRLLAERGIDVADHRSTTLSAEIVTVADLIITAERNHVAAIVGRWPAAFSRTVTLPEAVDLARRSGPRSTAAVDEWLLRGGTARRNALDYLDAVDVGEVEDPTGQSPKVWARIFAQIDEQTQALAKALS